MGDMLFRSERRGATRLVGVELMEKRYNSSVAFTGLLSSAADIKFADFAQEEFDEKFDDVLALNVIHHISDVHGFLMKAAELTKQRLIIEFPTFGDKVFRKLTGIPWWLPRSLLSNLPILGVSHSSRDQTFVMTLSAIERILSEAGNFRTERLRSPIKNRELVVFHRH